jgi:hypothetical protein
MQSRLTPVESMVRTIAIGYTYSIDGGCAGRGSRLDQDGSRSDDLEQTKTPLALNWAFSLLSSA